jgi:SAM-dependent methyltransferase
MKQFLKNNLSPQLWQKLKKVYYFGFAMKYRILGRPLFYAETTKAKPRRLREGFYDKYCVGKGLDVGHGGDKIVQDADGWDFEDGDAQYLKGIPDEKYDFVYSSHTLEHMVDAGVALSNWWRVVKPNGFLLLYIPHRDLYEKKTTLPSLWNLDHKHFFIIDHDEKPDTIGITPLIHRTLRNFEIVYIKECNEGHTITDPAKPSDGEYSIEIVLKKIIAK